MDTALSGSARRLSVAFYGLFTFVAVSACHSDSVTPPDTTRPPTVDTVATPSRFGLAWSAVPGSPLSQQNGAPGGHFMDVWFINSNEGWVVGPPGDVYHTTDAGANWTRLHSAASGSLYRSATFVSPTLGWVGDLNNFNAPESYRALWETRDGGVTFTNITSKVVGPEPVGICGMWSVDASTIFGVGRWNGPAVFVRSTDGGVTWTSKSLAPLLTGAVDVYFFDRLHGIIAGGRGVGNTPDQQNSSRAVVLSTADGGDTWTERYVSSTTGHWLWKISFPTPSIGYIAVQGPGSDRLVIKTSDGGSTWSEIVIPTRAFGFGGAGFVSQNIGWVGADTVAFETLDGGKTWAAASWDKGEDVNRFRILPSGVGFAVGTRIYKYVPPAN